MQDEVTKHTRKIYRAWKNPQGGVAEKIRDVLVEIAIIVFAVSLSIWLHSWSEHRHEQKEVTEFLTGLKKDLEQDIRLLERNTNIISRIRDNYQRLGTLASAAPDPYADSLINHFEVDLLVMRPNIGRYEGFKSSGKIGTIENDSLKENILIYYQQTLPDLVYGENFVNTVQLKIQELGIEKPDHVSLLAFARSTKIQSMLNLGSQNFSVNINGYGKAIREARKIIADIDAQGKH
jgi:hypothetical protein